MHTFAKQIVGGLQFLPKVALGAILIYSLLGIPFFIGYLHRYTVRMLQTRDFELPQWNQWTAMLLEGWELLVLILSCCVIPLAGSWLLAHGISPHLGWFSPLAWLPFCLLSLICPMLVSGAYHQFLTTGRLVDCLDFKRIKDRILRAGDTLFPATLSLLGFLWVGYPVAGLSLAIALVIYLPLSVLSIESHR
jgi:hypothetical protein